MYRSSIATLLVVLVTSACAHPRPQTATSPSSLQQSGTAQVPALDRHAVELSIRQAAARLDTAMLSGDTTLLTSIFARDAYFLAPSGDVANGAAAISSAFTRLRETTAQRVSIVLGQPRAEGCVDGGRDEGLYSVQQVAADGSRSTTSSGNYVTVWRVGSDGQARLQTLLFTTESTKRAALQHGRCATLSEKRFAKGRVYITAFPLGVGAANTGSQADATLAARGWTSPGERLATAPGTSRPELQTLRGGGGSPTNVARLAARLRFAGPFSIEAENQFSAIHGVISRSNTQDHEYDARYDERESSLLVTMEKSHLRIGVGAARVAASWQEVTYSAQYLPSGRYEIVTRGSPHTTAIGPEGLLAFSEPIHERALFELALQSRHGVKTTMQAVPGYDAWTAHFDGESLTLGFGVFF
jgi:ketosteroid isomerase-like protein